MGYQRPQRFGGSGRPAGRIAAGLGPQHRELAGLQIHVE
jgi:hypothetical protein